MAIRPSVRIKNVDGEYIQVNEAVKGRYSEAFGFETCVRVPVDIKTGMPRADRQYSEATFTKALDQASVLIYQYLCKGTKVPEVLVTMYDFDLKVGKEKVAYEMKFEDVTFTKQEKFIANAFSKEGEEFPVLEKVSFVAEKITETYLLNGHLSHQDCYEEKALDSTVTNAAAAAA